MTMLAGLAAAVLLWWLVKLFARAKPADVAKILRNIGGGIALAAAGLLAFRGRFDMAFLLGSGGAWLLGWNAIPLPFGLGGGARAARRTSGSISRVRSATIEMELDHDSGSISGTVLAGLFAGRLLDDLSDAELTRLLSACLADDADGARLLEAYLDRRMPGWREHAEPDPDPGRKADSKLGAMSKQEAYEVLGLQAGAGADTVRQAHRSLMKKLHPDQGGSTYLASRVNQAKDVLLDRHR
ncbi:DnaJ domain-containing protein [uncultured Enterovirga sp.]|uniref:DnaJ domain-containing protein n=1 Tax=uncultured Enterovirga sp. TaxID=2026352 RepID=UPI0035CC1DD2